ERCNRRSAPAWRRGYTSFRTARLQRGGSCRGGHSAGRSRARVSEVFVLAVVAALDAGLLTAAVVLLGRPRPPLKLLAYLIGGLGFSLLFGLLIVFALHGSKLLRGPGPTTSAVIELVVGALLIVIAIAVRSGWAAQWRPRPRRQQGDGSGGRYARA